MDNKSFKKIISRNTLELGFKKKWSAWIKETDETIIALMLKKSVFYNRYYLQIKINIKGTTIEENVLTKSWIKHSVADIFLSFDSEYSELFDLDSNLVEGERKKELCNVYQNDLKHLVDKATTKEGIIELADRETILLFPYTRNKLGLN